MYIYTERDTGAGCWISRLIPSFQFQNFPLSEPPRKTILMEAEEARRIPPIVISGKCTSLCLDPLDRRGERSPSQSSRVGAGSSHRSQGRKPGLSGNRDGSCGEWKGYSSAALGGGREGGVGDGKQVLGEASFLSLLEAHPGEENKRVTAAGTRRAVFPGF